MEGIKRPAERTVCTMAALTWGFVMTARATMSYFVVHIGLTAGQLGWLNCAMSVVAFFSALAAGRYVSAHGRHMAFLLVSLAGTAACVAATSLVSSFAGMLAVRLLLGLFAGPVYTLLAYTIRLASRPESYSTNIGLITLGEAAVSGILWPSLVVALMGLWGWRQANAALLLPLALFIAGWALAARRAPGAPAPAQEAGGGGFGQVLRYKNVVLCCFFGVLSMMTALIIYSYAPLYWVQAGAYSEPQMGALMTGMGVSMAVFSLLLPMLSGKLGRKAVVLPASLLAGLSLLVLFRAPDSWAAAALFVVFGGFPAILPMFAMSIISVESVPPSLCAATIALVNGTCELLGSALGPVLGGAVADRWGVAAAMLLGGVCMVLCVPVTALMRETLAAPAKK